MTCGFIYYNVHPERCPECGTTEWVECDREWAFGGFQCRNGSNAVCRPQSPQGASEGPVRSEGVIPG